jgi:predicted RNase H-like HicB family nuclease
LRRIETPAMVTAVRRYTVILTPDSEAGGFVVSVPALPGCVTEGDTTEEALANARDLIRLYITDLETHGESVPEEARQPALAVVEV